VGRRGGARAEGIEVFTEATEAFAEAAEALTRPSWDGG
jgi:hypothetical protein